MRTVGARFIIAMALVFAVKSTAAQESQDRFILKVGFKDRKTLFGKKSMRDD